MLIANRIAVTAHDHDFGFDFSQIGCWYVRLIHHKFELLLMLSFLTTAHILSNKGAGPDLLLWCRVSGWRR
jgi:hypothetical protein